VQRRIGRFEIERVLGQGGMGIVYVARDALLDRRVALKVLPPGREEDTADRQRLLREARSAAALSHPNVATVLEAGEDGGAVYLAMELVEGETLAERIARSTISEADVVRIGLGIARGLASAHASGVLHRDLKPANVILGPELTPKLVDFGLARAPRSAEHDERMSFTGIVIGTPGYMAPEQARGGATDARTDVFALGVVLQEMWSGSVPFGGTGLAALSSVLYDEPEPLEARRPNAPVELRELVRRCLSREPDHRPSDASVVVRVLAALATKREGPGPAIDPAPSGPRAMPLAPTIEVVRSSVKPRASISSLVGREREIEWVESQFTEGHRLITLAGPPGIGKTRLAAEIGKRATERGERAISVSLTNATTVADLEAAVHAALRRAAGTIPLAELLAIEDGILLLDGGEPIGEPFGACLEGWLAASPRLRLLVSSRNVSRAPSESVLSLAPLPEDVGVELFTSRARRTKPLLTMGEPERAAALEIARILDGNPLAIALAAARVSVLAPVQIATRLRERVQDRLALLQERGTTSLVQAIAWSFQLLDPEARALAVELSVIGGSFDAETAEAIAREPQRALDGLERLCDASLLRTVDDAGTARLVMDPNVRAFALRELEARPDAAAIRNAHLSRFATLAEHALASETTSTASRQTAEVRADLVIALAHALAGTDDVALAAGLRVAAALALHGDAHDPGALERALRPLLARASTAIPSQLRAHAELALARTLRLRDDHAAIVATRAAIAHAAQAGDARLGSRARVQLIDSLIATGAIDDAYAEASAAVASAKDVDAEIDALERLGIVSWRRSELDAALVALRQALSLVEARRDRKRQADVLHSMGVVCVQLGRLDDARAAYERARELARSEGSLLLVATIANNLGVIHHEQDRLDDARTAYTEASALALKSGRALLFAVARGNTAFVAQELEQRPEARIGLDEAIATCAAVGDRRYRAAFHLARACLLADEGDADRARADLAMVEALVGALPEPQMPVVIAIRTAYVDFALATTDRDPIEARLRAHLAELDRPDSLAARSDLSRMALRLVRRKLARGA
jgi:serine/threonine protein kinase/predicted ATPase